MAESRYIENRLNLSRYRHEHRAATHHAEPERAATDGGPRIQREELHKFVPFLKKKCGLEFRGRVLELGAGTAWFSAELSKLPRVVEVVTTDFSPKLLREQAPKMFKLLKAHEAKITRMPVDFYRLDFQNNHFDFVVCSALLHHGVNVLQLLRESRRVLKPGGQFIAIREPVNRSTRVKRQARSKPSTAGSETKKPLYVLSEYKHFFERAGLEITARRMSPSRGIRYYLKQIVEGRAPAHYALIGTKRSRVE
jgi:ubiquinone/menaquinone biosynthesis C-methylase UbiE